MSDGPERVRPIGAIARELGLDDDDVEPWGRGVAKIEPRTIARLSGREKGKLVLVTAITPTPAGEGKTTTTIGLVDALRRLGIRAAGTLRQPSLGPVFGIKGGGHGGGRSQIVPRERIDLHLTGDLHAVAAAHDLAAAFLDNHLHHGNALGIDPAALPFPRAIDIDDRALRRVVVGLGGHENAPARESEWIITAASEVMALLSLASDLREVRARLGRMVVARRRTGEPVTADDLRVAGAMAALVRDAFRPNLLGTLEGSPMLVHTGPFGNVAHGTSSVVADRVALALADVVCTEAGFGADLGAEKFFDIKCRQSGLRPAAAVLVATVRALKLHGGVGEAVPGHHLDAALEREDVAAVRRGAENLAAHLSIVRAFGVPCVVAVNAFPTDTRAELDTVREAALAAGARDAVVTTHFEEGGAGAVALARSVADLARAGAPAFELLYPDDAPLAAKVEAIATRVYGADGIDVAPAARSAFAELEKLGHGGLPVCIAKTHLSLSHDPKLRNRPRGFRLPVREARLAAGAGFVTVLAGEVRLMPGLPALPAGEGIDLDETGSITGLR